MGFLGLWVAGYRLRGFFVKVYKYMHIYLWTALRIGDLRMMVLRMDGFCAEI